MKMEYLNFIVKVIADNTATGLINVICKEGGKPKIMSLSDATTYLQDRIKTWPSYRYMIEPYNE
jgi:hypothetical protein